MTDTRDFRATAFETRAPILVIGSLPPKFAAALGTRQPLLSFNGVEEASHGLPLAAAVDGVIVATGALESVSGGMIARWLEGIGSPTMLVLTTLAGRECQILGDAAHAGADFAVLHVDGEEPIAELGNWVRERRARRGPLRDLIRAYSKQASRSVRSIVAAAAVLGSRRVKPSALAAALGMSDRTLRARLAVLGLPSPQKLLGLMVALHTAWRIDRRGLGTREAAALAGFESVKQLSEHLVAHVGQSVKGVAALGFDALLSQHGP